MVFWTVLKLIVFVRLVNCDLEKLKALDPNYGVTWMFMPDDKGNPYIVDLTVPDEERSEGRASTVQDDVTFYHYRQSTIDSPFSFRFVNDPATPLALNESYDPTIPTKFVIHGWRNSVSSPVSQNIKNNYLKREDMNVIVVDWAPLASDILYIKPLIATRNVGAHVGGLIDRMVEERYTDLSDVHMIGHSLGAHTSGVAGSSIRSGKVARITGLDPALPGFVGVSSEKMLESTDAQFVDIIHTCAGFLGYDENIGHVDFWPNGGRQEQPGCGRDWIGACSHGRSHEYYAESILRPDAFKAYPCENTNDSKCRSQSAVPMGDATPNTARGTLFLETNAEPEYGKGLL